MTLGMSYCMMTANFDQTCTHRLRSFLTQALVLTPSGSTSPQGEGMGGGMFRPGPEFRRKQHYAPLDCAVLNPLLDLGEGCLHPIATRIDRSGGGVCTERFFKTNYSVKRDLDLALKPVSGFRRGIKGQLLSGRPFFD